MCLSARITTSTKDSTVKRSQQGHLYRNVERGKEGYIFQGDLLTTKLHG